MKKYVIMLACLTICQFFSCENSSKVKKNRQIAINVDLDKEQTVSFFDFFCTIDLFPLETTEQSALYSYFNKLKVYNSHFFILDVRQNAVFEFDSIGKFIRSIKKQGRGPGEYTELYDFDINRFTNHAEFVSPWGDIHLYNSEINTHIETVRVKQIIHKVFNLTEDIDVCFFPDRKSGNAIFFFSRQRGVVLGECFPVAPHALDMSFYYSGYPMYLYHDTVRFCDGLNGDIYSIDPQSLKLIPRIQWDFGKYNFDASLLPADKEQQFYWDFEKYGNDQYIFGFKDVGENDQYFITSFQFKNRMRYLFFNKKTGQNFVFNNFKEGFSLLAPNVITEDYFYSYLPSVEYLDYVLNDEILTEENRNKISQLKEEDNPIVFRYKFKK